MAYATPRIIYSLWLQGRDNAPEIVRLNFERWESLNPGYEFMVLDAADVDWMLADFNLKPREMTMQALSDVVRTRLLQNGGVWVDATLFPTQPLDAWLPDLTKHSGFFAFERPGADRPLSTWFLAAAKNHVLMKKWLTEIHKFWSKPRQLTTYDGKLVPPDPVSRVAPQSGAQSDEFPYFWHHYLFAYLLEIDPVFAHHWNRCAKRSADAPHRLKRLFAEGRGSESAAVARTARCAPVHKLDWRNAYPMSAFQELLYQQPMHRSHFSQGAAAG